MNGSPVSPMSEGAQDVNLITSIGQKNKGWENIIQKPLHERFWMKAKKSTDEKCWLWSGKRDRFGYGVLNKNYKTLRAHRVSYAIHYGTIPEGKEVLHKCDVPGCVNPKHLFIGTQSDNLKDMFKKGRNKNQYSYPEKSPQNGRSRPVVGFIGGEWVLFESSAEASRKTKAPVTKISLVINGHRKEAGGIKWRRKQI